MIETPLAYRYPAESLARYRFHTGADLRPIARDEPCPILFRDVGPDALARFLRGGLRRLAGPYSPITYMRTAAYVEPYVDHEAIGRLVFLRPLSLHPWHSGVPTIYVARASATGEPGTIGFVPGTLPLAEAARRLADAASVQDLREELGGRHHDAESAETLARLERLGAELDALEAAAEPLRAALQSADPARREGAVAMMARAGLNEADLCAAWHHLPRDRRAFIAQALSQLGPPSGTLTAVRGTISPNLSPRERSAATRPGEGRTEVDRGPDPHPAAARPPSPGGRGSQDVRASACHAPDYSWHDCRFLTCSVLPVRVACNLRCPFCFSKSSISALKQERRDWQTLDVERYYRFARERGATRLVITGGGEPLLRPGVVVDLVVAGRRTFDEVALFTNGTYLTPALARRLADAGLSYVCYSRHAADDEANRALMGESAPALVSVLGAAAEASLRVRATCVMTRGHVDSRAEVWRYIDALRPFGVTEFTFKHTYVAYEGSVFRGTGEDAWAQAHRVAFDPFVEGTVVGELPWGPCIRRLGDLQVCYYHEPTPRWEREHGICRSSNLLSDGAVYASLEDRSSLLFRLTDS